jgi:hypothetical protein
VKIKLFEYLVDFYWVYFATSIFVEEKKCVSKTFVIFGGNSFSPGDREWFFGLFFGFGLCSKEEVGTFIHFIELKI